jgi:hypothetical protein
MPYCPSKQKEYHCTLFLRRYQSDFDFRHEKSSGIDLNRAGMLVAYRKKRNNKGEDFPERLRTGLGAPLRAF